MASNRERVLVYHQTSASSAIASFSAKGGLHRQPSAPGKKVQDEKQHRFGEIVPVDALNQVLKLCGQSTPETFEEALRLNEKCLSTRKLGEGCYADVYLIGREDAGDSVIKVVAVDEKGEEGTEKHILLAGAIPEVVITRELNNLRFNPTNQTSNFIELKGVHCVKGSYPAVLVKSWKNYDAEFCSEKENPESLDASQMYVIYEFEYGGETFDCFKGSLEMWYSAFLQVSCSLAVAESELEFEHRDLHCDNVLLSHTSEKEVRFRLNGQEVRFPTAGVRATIIDFTLSRIRKGEKVLFTDVAFDEELFPRSGSYQYEIYHIMRERNGNNWEAYNPATNVDWLHYLLVEIQNKCPPRSKRDGDDSKSSAQSALATFADTIRDFPSASAFVVQNLFPHHASPLAVLPASPQSSPNKPSQREFILPSPEKPTSHPMRLCARRT